MVRFIQSLSYTGIKPESSVLWTYMGIEPAPPDFCVGVGIEPMSIVSRVGMGNKLVSQASGLAQASNPCLQLSGLGQELNLGFQFPYMMYDHIDLHLYGHLKVQSLILTKYDIIQITIVLEQLVMIRLTHIQERSSRDYRGTDT